MLLVLCGCVKQASQHLLHVRHRQPPTHPSTRLDRRVLRPEEISRLVQARGMLGPGYPSIAVLKRVDLSKSVMKPRRLNVWWYSALPMQSMISNQSVHLRRDLLGWCIAK